MAESDASSAEPDAAVTERETLPAKNDRLRHLLLKPTRTHCIPRADGCLE
jgi:hypothetical protein